MVGEVRGGSGSPEFTGDARWSSGGAASIQGSLVAFRAWSLRGKEEKARAVNSVQSRRVTVAESTRIDRRSNGGNGQGDVIKGKTTLRWHYGTCLSARKGERERGPLVGVCAGSRLSRKMIR